MRQGRRYGGFYSISIDEERFSLSNLSWVDFSGFRRAMTTSL